MNDESDNYVKETYILSSMEVDYQSAKTVEDVMEITRTFLEKLEDLPKDAGIEEIILENNGKVTFCFDGGTAGFYSFNNGERNKEF